MRYLDCLAAVSEAVGWGGAHLGAAADGYRRHRGGRLVRDEPAASAVEEAFRRRAVGASIEDLAVFLEEQGAYPASGNRNWSSMGVRNLLRNPVYLGQARSGKVVKEDAHEPLVTRAEWDAAQQTRSLLPRPHNHCRPRRFWVG